MPLLTVITVVKDDVDGLQRTVASLANQEAADVDIVVVDGSTDRDEAPAAIRTLADVAYEWSTPRGVYPAMNEGLSRATGSYVYFLNAGDVLATSDVLARVTGALASSRPAWAFGRVRFRQADGATMREPEWSYAEERRQLFARGRFPAHQGVVVGTAALRDQGGFDTSYLVAADYASILSCASKGAPLELGFTLAEFTVGGLSTQQWKVAQAEFHRARREILAPTGLAAVREHAHTWRASVSTRAYRTLWAPGRPAHDLVHRLRSE